MEIKSLITGWALQAIHYNWNEFPTYTEPFVKEVIENGKTFTIVIGYTSSHKHSTDTVEFHGIQTINEYEPVISFIDYTVTFSELYDYSEGFNQFLLDEIKYSE